MRIGLPGTGTAVGHLRPELARPEHEVPPDPDDVFSRLQTQRDVGRTFLQVKGSPLDSVRR
jgi:hypothetical protein